MKIASTKVNRTDIFAHSDHGDVCDIVADMRTEKLSDAPFVTVIMPAFNSENYIAEALDSLSGQTYRNFEVIVVDDNSSDRSAEIAQSYEDKFPLTVLKLDANVGQAAARNAGIELAKGEWFALLDSDDVWLPNKLEQQIGLINENPDVSLVFSNGYSFDDTGELNIFYRREKNFPQGDVLKCLYRHNCFYASSVMVKAEAARAVGMFNTAMLYNEDYDLWIRVMEQGGRAMGVWEPIIKYRQRMDSVSKNLTGIGESAVKIYSEALLRISNPVHRRTLRKYLAKTRADLHLNRAIRILEQGGSFDEPLHREIYLAWRSYPKRINRLWWLVLSLRRDSRRLIDVIR